MKYIFDKNNKNKIGSLLELKDKCYYYEEDRFTFLFNINKNNWSFIYYHSFFSLVRDISDLSLFFIINEEISNSIKRKPFDDLMIELITNKHYKNEIFVNEKSIKFNEKKLKHTYNELQDLLIWKYNEILNSQLFDFSNSIFSAFEFWIAKLFDKLSNDSDTENTLINSRKDKYIKLIEEYNQCNEEDKSKILTKIMKLQGLYISFPDKINNIFKLLNKDKYIKNRNISDDKRLIDFLRTSRNTIHNVGFHHGKDMNFEFNGKKYELIQDKAQFIENHNDMILMYGELVDIYANILVSIDDITVEDYVKEEKDEQTFQFFNKVILDYMSNENIISKKDKKLILKNLKKIVLQDDKAKKILDFLDNKQNCNDNIVFEVLSANINI